MFQSSIALSGNTGSVQQLRAAMKSYHFHPITLVIIGMTALLKALGYMPMEFTPLGRSLDILSYCLRMALYLGVAIWLLPYVIRRGMLRNIPFALTSLCFLLVAITLNFVLLHSIFLPDGPDGVQWWRLGKILIYSTIMHLAAIAAMQSRLRPLLGRDSRLVPYFRPVPIWLMNRPAASLLRSGEQGEVLALNAQNQYVAVYLTSQKDPLMLRTTFSAAIALLPEGSGLQIHRSWWVAYSVLARATLDTKQTTLRSASGQNFPVGKTHLDMLCAEMATINA